jgi:hypothetical protein
MYNVSGFSLPPIIIDRHHITEKLLSMAEKLLSLAKNSKQSIIICCYMEQEATT